MDVPTDPRLGRGIRCLAAMLAGVLVLVACSSDDGDGRPGVAETEASRVDPEGVLRIGADLSVSAPGAWSWDPLEAAEPGQVWSPLVYGTLLRRTADATYESGLASGATIADPSTIRVELHPGLTFTDGSPLTSAEVKATIDRNVAANRGQAFRNAELNQIAAVTADGPTTLTITLRTPVAGSVFDLLAHEETMPVPPASVAAGSLGATPIGAGPYRLRTFEEGARIVLVRNEDYVHVERIRIPVIEIIHIAPGREAEAVGTGRVDVTELDTLAAAPALEARGIEVLRPANPDAMGFLWLNCAAAVKPELADRRVRQALNHATDKEAIHELLLDADGRVADQLWSSDTPFHQPDVAARYPHDVVAARRLLQEAGVTNLELTFADPGEPVSSLARLLRSQWAEIGVTLTVVATPDVVRDFYVDRRLHVYGSADGVNRYWTDKVTRNWLTGSVGNTCDPVVEEPTFPSLVTELRGMPRDDPRAVELWRRIATTVVEGAFGVFLTHGPTVVAVDRDRLGNLTLLQTQVGTHQIDIHETFVAR